MEDLMHTRDLLNSTLHQSRQIDFEIHKTSANLSRIHQSLETGKCAVKDRDHVVHPTVVSAVLNVYHLVNELGSLVSAPHSPDDFTLYLSLLKRFRQALTLLTNTCKLAILWVPDHLNVLLKQLQQTEEWCLRDQGIVGVALRVLQDEFRDLLVKNQCVLPSVVENLKAIVGCFPACDDRCMSIYVEVRTTAVKTSLQGLDLDYLDISFDRVQGRHIYEWGRHLEFVVKHLLQQEYTLCHQVFGHLDCFSKIALRSSGIQGFIRFGNTVTKAKKEAIKLFKLLEVFAALHNLRQDFNRFFGGKECSEIQRQTRDLIKKVVDGAFEIFQELSAQVRLQRLMDPPPDGSVPRLVSYVTAYLEELLDDEYRHVMDQVLEIHCSWYNANNNNRGLLVEVRDIIKSLEVNLETWAKRYEDAGLGCIFMMNTSCYLSKHVIKEGTRLGDLMGESWLKRHEDRVEYYAHVYLRETWGKMLAKNDHEKAFDEEYRKQSGWVVCDNSLRWRTCQQIVGVIVPVYKKRLRLGEGKYSTQSLEYIVTTSLLQPKYGGDIKLIDRIKSVVVGRFSPTTTTTAVA